MTPDTLRDLRSAAADLAWDAYDFGEAVVEDFNGWTSSGNEFSQSIYLEPLDPTKPTDKGHFTVIFAEDSDKIIDVYAMVQGNIVGMPSAEASAPRP
jgi:hypothetical protein